jgi:hypothetical protein
MGKKGCHPIYDEQGNQTGIFYDEDTPVVKFSSKKIVKQTKKKSKK